jgi:hypothetical protein
MYLTRKLVRLVATASLFGLWSEALGQVRSCSRLQPVGGAAGYQLRSGDSRCEGFYQSPVAGESLELLSLTSGRIDYRIHDDGTVHITAPNVSALNSAEIQVQARALPLGTYYLMESSIPSAGLMKWPMAPILAPAKLTPDTIGVIGWVEKDERRILVPVLVSERPSPRESGKSIIALLRSSIDLDALLWRSWPNNSSEKPPEWKRLGNGPRALRGGQPIEVELEPGKGIRMVEVVAKASNSDRWLALKRQVFEP